MPRQNRVTPYGELIAVPDRGMFWGNRGVLHDEQGRLVRYARARAWLICVLEFKGRRRTLMAPGRLTELFFLDEATGLAAGHRPCGECRYGDYQAFKRAFSSGSGSGSGSGGAPEIDARLHADRLVRPGVRRSYTAALSDLPDGTMVEVSGQPRLVYEGGLLGWTPGGYRSRLVVAPSSEVTVITPRSTVAALAAGYAPVVHPSAARSSSNALGSLRSRAHARKALMLSAQSSGLAWVVSHSRS
jgi:hypothetical protein